MYKRTDLISSVKFAGRLEEVFCEAVFSAGFAAVDSASVKAALCDEVSSAGTSVLKKSSVSEVESVLENLSVISAL